MCVGRRSSPPPPPPPPVAPPPPPPQITITPPPMISDPSVQINENEQMRPESPVRRRRKKVRKRGKAMLKIPLNTSNRSGVNV